MSRTRLAGFLAALLLLPVPALAGRRMMLNRSTVHSPIDSLWRGRIRHSVTRMQAKTPSPGRLRFLPTAADRARIERLRSGATDTVKVLCLRVEFVEDSTPLTTGSGRMDTFGFFPDTTGETTLLYDPPHFKRYFDRQMEAVRNYYRAMSLGRLYVDFRVFPDDEKRCYQLPRQMQFYGDTISMEGIEFGLVRLMRDALKVADEDPGIHFGDYDEFIIFHAGSGLQSDYAADGKSDSPYDLLAGEIPAGAIEAYLGEPYIRVDSGRTHVEQASVLPEMMRQDTLTEDSLTNLLGVTGLAGTLMHEFAHLLGAYDLYDVTGITMGVGGWSLMGYGGWLGDFSAGAPYGVIPAFLDAYHRVALGFVSPLVVRVPRESIPVYAAAMDTGLFPVRSDTSTPTIIKIPITPREYFLVENRQTDVRKPDTIIADAEDGVVIAVESNEYDFFQPGSGILIWHVDDGILADWGPINWVNASPLYGPEHKGVDMEEADGIQDFDVPYYLSFNPNYEIYGYRYDAFIMGGYGNSFTALTTPASDGYTGRSFLSVTLLGEADSTARLKDTVIPVRVGWDLLQPGFPVNQGRLAPYLSAFVCDLDRDDSVEIAVIDTTGQVSVWKQNGTGFRPGNGRFVSIGAGTRADVAVGDVSGDSLLEVVTAGNDGRVKVFSASGVELAVMSTADRVVAAPALFDLNGDGKAEVVVGSTDMKLYAWRGDGGLLPGFPKALGTEVRAAAAWAPGQGIVVLTGDSRLFLVRADGTVAPGFPVVLGNSSFYATAQPVVADFDRDSVDEVAVVAGGEHDFCFHLVELDGTVAFRSAELVSQPFAGRLAAGDVNEDGFLDVVCASKFRTYAFNYNGTLVSNFPLRQESSFVTTELAGNWIITFDAPFLYASSPVVADVDGDGGADVAIGSPVYGLLGFDCRAGVDRQYFPLMTTSSVSAVPLVCDLDRDGDMEIAVGSDSGVFYVWDLPASATGSVWQCAYHDAAHTGYVPRAELPPLPAADTAMLGSFYLYPNPAAEQVIARYRLGPRGASVRLLILDMSGEPVADPVAGQAVAGAENETTLDLRLLAPGLYVVRAEATEGTRRSVKFAKLAVVR